MPARKKKTSTMVGVGMTAKQMRRKKPYNSDMMIPVEPLTDNQRKLFDSLGEGKNVYTYGVSAMTPLFSNTSCKSSLGC